MAVLNLTFEQERATTNTIKYREVAQPGVKPCVGTLYLHKEQANNAKTVQVTIDTGVENNTEG